MRILLAGSRWFGVTVFAALRQAGHEVVAVWDRTDGRLATAARDVSVRVLLSEKVGHPGWLPAMPELVVAAHCTWHVDTELLERCRFGGIGYHPSLLPLHRGGDAIRWAIHMRERVTGGTVYWLTEHADAGPILSQDWCFIRPTDTAEVVWQRELAPMGVRMLVEACSKVAAGDATKRPQDQNLATWEPTFRRPSLTASRHW